MNTESQEDHIPPMDILAEQSLLGAMLIDSSVIDEVRELVTAQDFYRDTHISIFTAILELIDRQEPIDLVTIQSQLNSMGVLDWAGGVVYLVSLFDVVPTAAHAEHYAAVVKEKSLLRKIIHTNLESIGLARTRGVEPEQVIRSLENSIANVSRDALGKTSMLSFNTIATSTWDKYRRAKMIGKDYRHGMTIGYVAFDEGTNGLQPSDLIGIVAESHVGKTSFALSIADHVATQRNEVVAIFEAEMSPEALYTKMLCSRAQMAPRAFRRGELGIGEEQVLLDASQALLTDNIQVLADATFTPTTIRNYCRVVKREKGLHLIIVDYLELMETEKQFNNEVQRIDYLIRQLKQIAMEFECVVMVLLQTSNDLSRRDIRRPQKRDIRGSGAIYAAADWMYSLYNPTWVKMQENPQLYKDKKRDTLEEVEVNALKGRNDVSVSFNVGFIGQYTAFVDLEDSTNLALSL